MPRGQNNDNIPSAACAYEIIGIGRACWWVVHMHHCSEAEEHGQAGWPPEKVARRA